jgi:hypothetical protein
MLNLLPTLLLACAAALDPPATDPLGGFRLPDAWQDRFWVAPGVSALLDFEPGALAALVPTQAGLRFCRCPSCGASEIEDPLDWSPAKPGVVTCRRCGVAVPSEVYPARVPLAPGLPPSIPDEVVEVRPRVFHHYPFHLVEPEKQAYPDERLYLSAKRDYEARAFLAKAALYAAVRHRDQPAEKRDPRYARLASVLLLRFAQVYGGYALHDDRPDEPKILHTVGLKPPFRPGYRTSRWDWLACHEVPIPLLVAYAILRDDPALAEAGIALAEPEPVRLVREALIRPAAALLALQPDDDSESTLYAARGLLAAAVTLEDRDLLDVGLRRLERVLVRGFRHDGSWPATEVAERARVAALLSDWIRPLIEASQSFAARPDDPRLAELAARLDLALAAAPPTAPEADVLQAAYSADSAIRSPRPSLLGGTGLAHLAAGPDPALFRLALGPPDAAPEAPPIDLRVEVAGRRILGAATPGRAGTTTQPLFHAADATLQIVALASRDLGPHGDATVRQLVVTVTGPAASYAVSLLEPAPGAETAARWTLADGLRVIETGDLRGSLDQPAARSGPSQLELLDPNGQGVRLHLLDSGSYQVYHSRHPGSGESFLVVSRQQASETAAPDPFAALLEPIGPLAIPVPERVGRLPAPAGLVALAIETRAGREYLVVNREPGTAGVVNLPGGGTIQTDGLVALVRDDRISLAGGTFARHGDRRVEHPAYRGTVRASRGLALDGALGSFELRGQVGPIEGLAGRTLLIRHGDGVSRAWTITRADLLGDQWARYWVREDPAFVLDASANTARDHSFPQADHPGPHSFAVCLLTHRDFASP